MKLAVIIPAAGHASRYLASGANRHKLDEDLAGRSVLERSVELFANRDEVSSIVVAGPHDEDEFAAFKDRYGPKLGFLGATLVRGGAVHRYDSVKNALAEVPADATHVAVHDAARPCASTRLINRLLEAAVNHPAVVPGLPVADTLKHTHELEEVGDIDPLDAILGEGGKANPTLFAVTRTLDRSGLMAIQTPQIFTRALITRAYDQSDLTSTDDASLVEKLGEPVAVVRGERRNLKITTLEDLEIARFFFKSGGSERSAHKRF